MKQTAMQSSVHYPTAQHNQLFVCYYYVSNNK